MLKKTITYTDYNGNERTKDYYFNLSKAEIIDMQLSSSSDLGEKIQKIVASGDQAVIYEQFKSIILKSYGIKSDDGNRFIKSPELTEEFTQTEAFSELMIELCTDANFAAAFVNGIFPKDLQDHLEKAK